VTYATHTRTDLRKELRARGLSTGGDKDRLIERLEEDDAAAEAEELDEDADDVDEDEDLELDEDEVIDLDEGADEVDEDEVIDLDEDEAIDRDDVASDEDWDDDEPYEEEFEDDGPALDGEPDEGEALEPQEPRPSGRRPLDIARSASAQLTELTRKRPEAIVGMEPAERGWRVLVDVVEVERIPPATTLLGTYEVVTDDDGELLRYERLHRFMRGQTQERDT
jgi:hypothetical protein